MDLMGPNLHKIMNIIGKGFSFECVCLIALKMISLIKRIHGSGIIHGNISPFKILVSRTVHDSKLYLIDFKKSRKLNFSIDPLLQINNGPKKFSNEITIFSTSNAVVGSPMYRRDDIEGLAYTLIFLMRQGNVYKGLYPTLGKSNKEQFLRFNKLQDTVENLTMGLPSEIAQLLQYSKSLKITDKPDYSFLKYLFKRSLVLYLNSIQAKSLYLAYDWVRLLLDKVDKDRNIEHSQYRVYFY